MIFKVMRNIFAGVTFVVRPIFLKFLAFCSYIFYAVQLAFVGYVYYRMIYLLRYLIIVWIRRQKIVRINLYFSYLAAAVHRFTQPLSLCHEIFLVFFFNFAGSKEFAIGLWAYQDYNKQLFHKQVFSLWK